MWTTLVAGSVSGFIGGFLVMAAKSLFDMRVARRERKRQLKALLTLIDVEAKFNAMAASIHAINPEHVTVSIREGLKAEAWKDTRVRIAELIDNTDHFDKIAHYYEDVELQRDVLWRSELPQMEPKKVTAELNALVDDSKEIGDLIKQYLAITEQRWWQWRR